MDSPILGLLHFGSGDQATHYFALCLGAILGTLQIVAARYKRADLLWLEERAGFALGIVLVVGSFVWFFATDKEIFVPGLAGGEFFTLFAAAFATATPLTRVVAFALSRLRPSAPVKARFRKELAP